MGPRASSAAVAVFYFAVAVFYFVGLSEWRRFTGMIPAASADLNTKVGVVVGTAVFFSQFFRICQVVFRFKKTSRTHE